MSISNWGRTPIYSDGHVSTLSTASCTTRWGIVGTGGIARVVAERLNATQSGVVAGVCSRTAAAAEEFCAAFGGAPTTAVENLLPEIDALYIATPHSHHRSVAIEALQAGVAVLCEKPMTCTQTDTATVIQAARTAGTPLMEAWMYRTHPQIERTMALLRSGVIGDITHIDATFGFQADVDEYHRLRNPALGGGAILDVGGYPMSLALLLTSNTNQPAAFTTITASGRLDTTGVDAHTSAELTFDNGVTASLGTSIDTATGMRARVQGTSGSLTLPHPFLPEGQRNGTRAVIELDLDGHHRSVDTTAPMDCFSLEARVMHDCIADGRIEPTWPLVTHEASLAIAGALDRWRHALTEHLTQ